MSKKHFRRHLYAMYALLALPVLLVACAAATSGAATASGGGLTAFLTSGNFPIIMGAFISGLGTMLPLIQLWLKKMPTTESVKFTGWFGAALDVLTWYQKDVIKSPNPVNLSLDSAAPAPATSSGSGMTAGN